MHMATVFIVDVRVVMMRVVVCVWMMRMIVIVIASMPPMRMMRMGELSIDRVCRPPVTE